jgi:uncharacterized protein YjiS (DUF1127 family)
MTKSITAKWPDSVVSSSQPIPPVRLGLSLLKYCWAAIRELRAREKLVIKLYELSDRELRDIGITRGEIDYVASNRGIDPRGI